MDIVSLTVILAIAAYVLVEYRRRERHVLTVIR